MPAWALRVIAVVVTGLTMVGSTTYALAHPKNANAPLQPPVAEQSESTEPEPGPTPEATLPFRTLAPTVQPTPTPVATTAATPPARASGVGTTSRATAAPTATPTPRPTATLRGTPVPQITLAAGVRATSLPKITITHRS